MEYINVIMVLLIPYAEVIPPPDFYLVFPYLYTQGHVSSI